jgi:hypothetical protein
MQMEYEFYISPLFEGVDVLQDTYEDNVRAYALDSRDTYFSLLKTGKEKVAADSAIDGKFEKFTKEFGFNE